MVTPNHKIMYCEGLIGFGVQGTIGKKITYRLRHGNGQYGAILNRLYQDKFSRVVPSSIEHPNGDASRACFANAVAAWQSLTAADKKRYNDWAHHIRNLSGYNLFIRRYMLENY